MSYITTQDMVDQFGEREMIALSDRIDANEIDAAVVARAIDTACSEVDAYVAGKAAVPLTTVPPIVNRHACNMARFHLVGAEAQLTDEIRAGYDDAVRFLRDVAAGRATLGVDAQGATAAVRDTVRFGSADRSGQGGRVFARENAGDII